RDLQLVRVRRPQRRALPGSPAEATMSVAIARRAEAADPRLGPRERLELLCDPGSLHAIRSAVTSRRSERRSRPGDGVVAGSGTVDGRPVYCYAQDGSFAGGSLGE